MRKLIFTFVLAAFIMAASTEKATAQFGIQGGVTLPMGGLGDFVGMGVGGQVFYKKESGDGMKIGGTAGFYSMSEGDFEILGSSFAYTGTIIPVLVTFDYELADNFYAGADAGYNIISLSTDDDLTGFNFTVAGSSLALVPKAGIKFGPVSVEARYNVLGDNYLSALVGFSFGE